MAAGRVVGSAYIVVRAITAGVDKDIKNGFGKTDRIGQDAGDRVGDGFRRGFSRTANRNIFGNLIRDSIAAKERFSSLTRVGYVLAPVLTGLSGIIGLLGTGIISLASTIGATLIPAMLVLGQAATALGQAMLTLKLAFSGVGKAIQAGTKAKKGGASAAKGLEKAEKALERAQRALGEAYEDAAKRKKDADDALLESEEALAKARKQAIEDLQQLGFESEDAAIAEQKAALELEKAREELARVSDLPPNSRARKEAELAFAQADLNYRRAIDRNNDLKTEEAKNAELAKKGPEALIDGQEGVVEALKTVAEAKQRVTDTEKENARAILAATEARDDARDTVDELKNGAGAADAYADALSDLSKEARAFVEYMVTTFIPSLKELKEAAGRELFPRLEEALETLRIKLFPALIPLLEETGKVLGDVAKNIADVITQSDNLERLENIWKSNDKVIKNLGDALGELIEVLLILTEAFSPLTEEFTKFLGDKIKGYKEFLETEKGMKQLADRTKIARDTLADLGAVFGNTFRGLNNLFWANVGPGSGGQIFLDYLKDVTKRFEELETIDGKPVKQFFADAAVNGTLLLDLIGNILGGFITLADNKGLGIFLGQLNEVVDIFQEIGEELDASLPSFGNFLIEFSKFIALVTESGSITIYFDTLSKALGKLNEFLSTDLGQRILNISAQVLPLLAAFGFLVKIASFFGKVVFGAFAQLFTPIAAVTRALMGMGVPLSTIVTTFLKFVGIAGLVITVFMLLWKNSEIFREAVMLMVQAVGGALKGAFDDIMAAIKSVFPTFEGIGTVFETLGNIIGTVVVPILSFVLVRAIGIVSGAIQKFIFTVGTIKDVVLTVWNFFKGTFELITGQTDKAAKSFKNAWSNAVSAVKNIIKSIAAPFVAVLNAISDAWNNSVGKFNFKVPSWVPIIGGKTFNVPNLPRITLANLAEEGVVLPTAGGTLARIAEAGRPERVEPLDPDGLSERDKAIIDRLSGGPGGKAVTVNVYPSEGMDERELAAIVSRQIAFQLRRGAA